MILYKYRAISSNTDAIFTSQSVWLSTAIRLNDPFECKIGEIAKDWIEARVSEAVQAHLASFLVQAKRSSEGSRLFFGLPPKATKKLLKEFGKYKRIETAYTRFREFMKAHSGNYPSDPRATFARFDDQLQAGKDRGRTSNIN